MELPVIKRGIKMIAMLTSEDVIKWWDLIKEGVRKTLPTFAKDAPVILSNVLEAILARNLYCWCIYEVVNGEPKTYGFFLTQDIENYAIGTKGCIIISLHTVRFLEDNLWVEFIQDLRKSLKSLGYNYILAWSGIKRIVEMSAKAGANVENVLMFTEV